MTRALSADGRFAPSPSGPLHVGNLRTALLAWALARRAGARFLVRIEDLDPARSRPEHERGQLEDLRALGLDWDEAPVRQSERAERYRAALEALRAADAVYPCWCTRAEIREAATAPHGVPGAAAGHALPAGAYPGTCARLGPRGRAERERGGRPTAWRLRAEGARIGFRDALHGECAGVVDDFVLWRGDGAAAYNLAVIVDDADQRVGEVVRGEDLLEGTPRQVLLAARLGLPAPRYAHVPLVLGPDGARLAKRHGAVTLADLGAQGVGIAQVLGWMARTLGVEVGEEPPSARAIAERLSLERVPRAATVLAPQALLGAG
jgi:glutamyl-tRNA synthetase